MSTNLDNRVQLLGFLGQDVELREFAQGKKLARLRVATTEFKKAQNGQSEKVTTWHDLVAWGQTAETMSDLLRKGHKVFVEGKIAYRQYETKAGEKRSSTEIVVSSFRKLDRDQKAA
ncbi:MAG TPA: single-stranded DNA-binding protein [Saprospiraceae bacterium]|nr:single-stranded DNA-binding protein [Saprospiraceae bacterium]